MIRFAPLLALISLFAGYNQTSAAQERSQVSARSVAPAEQRTSVPQIVDFAAGQDTVNAAPPQSVMERLPPKIHEIQRELPVWIQQGDDKVRATTLTRQLEAQLNAKNFAEAEKTADAILAMMRVSTPSTGQNIPVIPEEARRRLRHDLGSSFLVYRDRIQQELKLTSAQQDKLEQFLRELLPDAILFFHKIDGLKPEERERELGAYRPKALARLAVVLKATLTEGQRQRLRQMERQREGLFGDGESWQDLHVTDEQRQQFMATIQQAKQKIDPLLEAAQSGGNPNEIRPRVMQMRLDLESKLEALLTNTQRKQWKEMLGKPMDLSALFDM